MQNLAGNIWQLITEMWSANKSNNLSNHIIINITSYNSQVWSLNASIGCNKCFCLCWFKLNKIIFIKMLLRYIE